MCVKIVLDSRDEGIKIWPTRKQNNPWDMVYFMNSDYVTDPVTRIKCL